jgi:hypothetical protein
MRSSEKIGMCCGCGGTFAKSQTKIVEGGEYCEECADAIKQTKKALAAERKKGGK